MDHEPDRDATPRAAVDGGLTLIRPDWPAPARVHALATTRAGGVSRTPFSGLNLALHTGDRAADVLENRRRLAQASGVGDVQWLEQVHGTDVFAAQRPAVTRAPVADAAWTADRGLACAVLTADCLPVLICDVDGTLVAAVHAGWRGLVGGVLEQTIAVLPAAPDRLLAWIGPGISGSSYEVGDDVRAAVATRDGTTVADRVLSARGGGKWSFDLAALARTRLRDAGVGATYGGGFCTFRDGRFYSYRRDGITGRMAAMVWLG
jgi:polyphenol oxidase